MESDFSMSKDENINPTLLAQGYSDNTNESSNLHSIPLNHSNQSNLSSIISSNNSSLDEKFKKDEIINLSLLPQEYSNNTNQSNNLPFIPLNHSNQSNFSIIISSNNSSLDEKFKKEFPSHAEILEKQIESYIAGEEMNKFIK